MNILRSLVVSLDTRIVASSLNPRNFVPCFDRATTCPTYFFNHGSLMNVRHQSTAQNTTEGTSVVLTSVSQSSASNLKVKKISKAMQTYLERAQKYEDFMKLKTEEFEIGKQHLANMMGLDADSMTQEDIDKAIRYLMPSGLYQPKARPMMKPPEQIYPKEKAAQFDESGRPFSPFFYTIRANFYQCMHELVAKFNELDAFEDKMIQKGILEPPPETRLNLSGGNWLTIEELCLVFVEEIYEVHYNFLITTLTRLAEHPYAFRIKDHIWKYRRDFEDLSVMEDIPPLMYDENKRPYMESLGKKKKARSHVIVYGDGTGKITINNRDISYFHTIQEREKLLFPLQISGMLGQVDVVATVEDSGSSAQAAAIRYGIAMSLRSFVSSDVRLKMRFAGLLTHDKRRRERKKPGQKGARAKFTWKKR